MTCQQSAANGDWRGSASAEGIVDTTSEWNSKHSCVRVISFCVCVCVTMKVLQKFSCFSTSFPQISYWERNYDKCIGRWREGKASILDGSVPRGYFPLSFFCCHTGHKSVCSPWPLTRYKRIHHTTIFRHSYFFLWRTLTSVTVFSCSSR